MKAENIKEIMECARTLQSSLAVPVMLDHGEALKLIVSDLVAKYHHNAERGHVEWTSAFRKVLSYYLSADELESLTSTPNDQAHPPRRSAAAGGKAEA